MRAAVLCVFAAACTSSPKPAAVSDADTCAFCRMAVSDAHLAAQIVAPGEEPRIYDDIGCLVNGLKREPTAPDSVAYVADHRTGEWVRASAAVYTRVSGLSTPMGSHIVAHSSLASRNADDAAKNGQPVTGAELFGATGAPGEWDVR